MNKQKRLFDMPETDENKKYTKKIMAPQYVPSKVKPIILELYNSEQYSALVKNIKSSNVTDEEKDFLLKAATRHIVFNYDKIADYYAHASKEMQELMEQSALVIIDIDDAIANGYVKVSKTIKDIVGSEENGE